MRHVRANGERQHLREELDRRGAGRRGRRMG
jgi:hypothetical protein